MSFISFPDRAEDLRILLTNDDGINAFGMDALIKIARSLSDDVWICAPSENKSAVSRALTIDTVHMFDRLDEKTYSLSGTPTDCITFAVSTLFAESKKPHLCLSGVNKGSNVGEDVHYSGTVQAALEAAHMGIPSMALSVPVESPDLSVAIEWGPQIIRNMISMSWFDDAMLNVNFPKGPSDTVTGMQIVPQTKSRNANRVEIRQNPRGRDYYWLAPQQWVGDVGVATDLGVVRAGGIAVTPLHTTLGYKESIVDLQQRCGQACEMSPKRSSR